MTTNGSLELEALIRPVSTLLLEVRGLLLRSTSIPGIDKLKEDTPPSSLKTSTGNMDVKVISLDEVKKVKNNTSSQKAPQHPHSIYKTPEHSTIPINTPEVTHKSSKKHNTYLDPLDTSKKYTDTHTPDEFIESKLAKLHIVPLRKYTEIAPPDDSIEEPKSVNTTGHAPLTSNTSKDLASQIPTKGNFPGKIQEAHPE